MTQTPFESLEPTAQRRALIGAMLPHVPFDGFGPKALVAGAADLGVPVARARMLFPGGQSDLLLAYLDKANADLEETLAQRGLSNKKVRERITLAVRTRLEWAETHREAAQKVATLLALPGNAGLAARAAWSAADVMWRAAGDTATDYNHYSKRAILSGVYAATLLCWLQDESAERAETWAFLDRRIADVMQFEKAKARWKPGADRLPSLTRFLGRLRYRTAA